MKPKEFHRRNAFVAGLVSTEASPKVVPELQLMKSGTSLVVSKCPTGLTWADIIVTGTATKLADATAVSVGQSITACSGQVNVALDGELVGMFNFD